MRLFLAFLFFVLFTAPAAAQELPNEGQSEAAFAAYLAGKPAFAADVAAFERWQRAKGLHGILPTWQLLRTASMWQECNGPPFEVPPRKLWPAVGATLRFIRDHVRGAIGPVEAVSVYRNPALNLCARGAARSAHRDFTAVDLVPVKPISRRVLFDRLCFMHRHKGAANGVGLGFYAFRRFHIDTRSFRTYGSSGPRGNESPCRVLERGGDPEAPPIEHPAPPPMPVPDARLAPATPETPIVPAPQVP